jgi:hypothetical protein
MMRDSSGDRGPAIFRMAGLGLLLAALPVLCSASSLSPKRENMSINWAPVVVEYEPSATAQDVMLPVLEGAKIISSFHYAIDTKEGKPVLRYASVTLTTRQSAEQAAAEYSAKLPGNPRPEVIQDESGKRLVLAVGNAEEVRMVTITAQESGARVELVRATEPAAPQGTPPEIQRMPQRRQPPGRLMRRGRPGGMRV